MNQLAYWTNWPKPLNTIFWLLLTLVAGSILYYIIALIGGPDWVIDWQVRPELQALPTAVPAYQHPLTPIQSVVDTYIIKQTYWGSLLKVNVWAAWLSLGLCLTGVSIMLTAITTLKQTWFLVGLTLFIALVMLLQLEQLGVAGQYNNAPVYAIFIVMLPLAYYLHSFRQHTSFVTRLALISVAVLALAIAIGLLAEVGNPALYVMNYGLPAWLGLTVILMAVVAPEIIVAALALITRNTHDFTGSNRNVQHFLVIGGIYLLNLFLYYLKERGIWDPGFFYLGPFWIFPLSLILAFWTLRMRAATLGSIVQVEPFGLFIFAGLAILGTATAAYAAATDNTPLLETLEDAILYTHLGIGIAFILYLIVNFYGLIRQGQPVYKIMYRPAVMPLFTARFLGVIITIGFYLLQGNYVLFTPMAAFNNAIGDIYNTEDNLILSQQYYKESSNFKFANHRANYALASLAINENRPVPATIFLKQLLQRNPSPYAYANLSNLYQQNDLSFDALATLRQGVGNYPQSGPLYNNLGLRYHKWRSLDSAIYFLQAASQDSYSQKVAYTNELGILAQSQVQLSADSLAKGYSAASALSKINLLSLLNQQKSKHAVLPALPDTIWQSNSPYNAGWVLNYSLYQPQADTALATKVLKRAQASGTGPYEEQWLLAAALLHYRTGRTQIAFELLSDLANRSIFNAIAYYNLLGQWAMEQNAPRLAATWFKTARDRGYAKSGIYEALALADAGLIEKAKEALLFLADSNLLALDRQHKHVALVALQQGAVAPDELVPPTVKLRLGYSNYLEAEIRNLLLQIKQISAEEYTSSVAFIINQHLKAGNTEKANEYSSLIKPELKPENIKEKIALMQVRVKQTVTGNWPWLLALNKGNLIEAERLLAASVAGNPFNEEAIMMRANILNRLNRSDEAYGLLRNALNLNKYSVNLLKAYALQSVVVGLDAYGEDALTELGLLIDSYGFEEFKTKYINYSDSINAQSTW